MELVAIYRSHHLTNILRQLCNTIEQDIAVDELDVIREDIEKQSHQSFVNLMKRTPKSTKSLIDALAVAQIVFPELLTYDYVVYRRKGWKHKRRECFRVACIIGNYKSAIDLFNLIEFDPQLLLWSLRECITFDYPLILEKVIKQLLVKNSGGEEEWVRWEQASKHKKYQLLDEILSVQKQYKY